MSHFLSLRRISPCIVIFFVGFFFVLPHLFGQRNTIYAAVVINELLPKTSDSSQEWIELYNNGSDSVSLDRWRLQNTAGDSKTYILNASSILPSHTFLVLYGTQTGITFYTGGDSLQLIDEKNTTVDTQSYPGILGYNTSMGRSSDGGGIWSICTTATPNQANDCPAPTATPIPPTPLPTNTLIPTPTEIPTPLPTMTGVPTLPPIISLSPSVSPVQNNVLLSTSSSSQTDKKTLLGIAGLFISFIWIVFLIMYTLKNHKKKNPQ